MQQLAFDLRVALRQLRKTPGFTVVSVLTIALAIGANTAIFTLVHAVMLKRLPVSDPAQLYVLGDSTVCCDTTEFQQNFALYSYPLYQQVRDNTTEFSSIAAFQPWVQAFSVRRSGAQEVAESFNGYFVSGNYFSTLGVKAYAGRNLSPADDRPNAAPVAMMSYRAWQLRYGSDRSVIGATFVINGAPVSIIGITPAGFFGETLRSDPPDFWSPLSSEPMLSADNPLLNQPSEYWLLSIGRLQPGIAPAQAQARVAAEVQQWFRSQGAGSVRYGQQISNMRLLLTPAGNGTGRLRQNYRDGLLLLLSLSGLVLLIACANVANLLIARGMSYRSEAAIRVALGASRASMLREALTRGTVLALMGGTAGVAFAFGGTRILLALAFRGAKYIPIDPRPSVPVLGFAFALSLLTGIGFSLALAWFNMNTEPMLLIRKTGRSISGSSATSQKVLIVLQAALSLVLLAGAGLLTKSLANLQNQQLGLETQSRLIVRINPALAGYKPDQLPVLYRELEDRFARIPGVRSASLALHTPMDNWNWGTVIFVAGRTPSPNPDNEDQSDYNFVSPHYFETIGTRLLRGRAIGEQDTPNSHFVAVVNQAFAGKFFSGQDPMGKHVGMNEASHAGDYEIIGVVEDTKYRDPKLAARPMIFMPLLQIARYSSDTDNAYQVWANYVDSVQLRVVGHAEAYEPIVRETLADINPNLSPTKVVKFEDQIGTGFNTERLIARLTGLYALLALVLAAIGLYGVAAYLVTRRTTEIGVRMALGAKRSDVVAMVLRSVMTPIAAGLAIGIPAVFVAGRGMASQLFGVSDYDPMVLIAAVAALSISALLAAILPARRAVTIDPLQALRMD